MGEGFGWEGWEEEVIPPSRFASALRGKSEIIDVLKVRILSSTIYYDPAKNRTWVSSKSTMRSAIRLRDLWNRLLFCFLSFLLVS